MCIAEKVVLREAGCDNCELSVKRLKPKYFLPKAHISRPYLPYSAAILGGEEALASNHALAPEVTDQKISVNPLFRRPNHEMSQETDAFSKKREYDRRPFS